METGRRVLWDGSSQLRNLVGILCCAVFLSISPYPKCTKVSLTGISDIAGKITIARA